MSFNMIWEDNHDIGNLKPYDDSDILQFSSNAITQIKNIKIHMLHRELFMCLKIQKEEIELIGFVKISNISDRNPVNFIKSFANSKHNDIDTDFIFNQIKNFIKNNIILYLVPIELSNALSISDKINLYQQIFISKFISMIIIEQHISLVEFELYTGKNYKLQAKSTLNKPEDMVLLHVGFSNNTIYKIEINNEESVIDLVNNNRSLIYSGNINNYNIG